jgi:hypothetical protein
MYMSVFNILFKVYTLLSLILPNLTNKFSNV